MNSENTLNNEQAPAASTWGSVLQEKESTPHSAPLGTADSMHPSLSLLLVRKYGRPTISNLSLLLASTDLVLCWVYPVSESQCSPSTLPFKPNEGVERTQASEPEQLCLTLGCIVYELDPSLQARVPSFSPDSGPLLLSRLGSPPSLQTRVPSFSPGSGPLLLSRLGSPPSLQARVPSSPGSVPSIYPESCAEVRAQPHLELHVFKEALANVLMVTTWKDATTSSEQIVSGTYISKLSTVQASKGEQKAGRVTTQVPSFTLCCVTGKMTHPALSCPMLQQPRLNPFTLCCIPVSDGPDAQGFQKASQTPEVLVLTLHSSEQEPQHRGRASMKSKAVLEEAYSLSSAVSVGAWDCLVMPKEMLHSISCADIHQSTGHMDTRTPRETCSSLGNAMVLISLGLQQSCSKH
ncbi:hypothetical protein U0070_025321 [Myodes glareolus]|uniref:Uncharacterized protein n=1 Tax=Myodes glareolus TaxID=447135 RepID=A0AAW0JP00_MYOGA